MFHKIKKSIPMILFTFVLYFFLSVLTVKEWERQEKIWLQEHTVTEKSIMHEIDRR